MILVLVYSSLFAFTSKYFFRLIKDSNNENINIKLFVVYNDYMYIHDDFSFK